MEAKAEIIADIYEMQRKDRQRPQRQKVIEIIRAAA